MTRTADSANDGSRRSRDPATPKGRPAPRSTATLRMPAEAFRAPLQDGWLDPRGAHESDGFPIMLGMLALSMVPCLPAPPPRGADLESSAQRSFGDHGIRSCRFPVALASRTYRRSVNGCLFSEFACSFPSPASRAPGSPRSSGPRPLPHPTRSPRRRSSRGSGRFGGNPSCFFRREVAPPSRELAEGLLLFGPSGFAHHAAVHREPAPTTVFGESVRASPRFLRHERPKSVQVLPPPYHP